MDKETIDSKKCIDQEDTNINDVEERLEKPFEDCNSDLKPHMEQRTHNGEASSALEANCANSRIEEECDKTGNVTEMDKAIEGQQTIISSHSSEKVPEMDKAIEGHETIISSHSLDNAAFSNNVVIESVIELSPITTGICDTTLLAESNINKPTVGEVMDITDKETNEVQLMEDQTANKSRAENPKNDAPSGLDLLSQYDDDDDEDDSNESETASVIEVPIMENKNYRSQVVEIDSDTAEIISSDSDSESETESEYLVKISKHIEKRIQSNDNDDEDDDDNDEGGDARKGGRRQPPRVRGEMLLDDLPPIQDLQISVPADECIELGRVHSIIDQLLLVNALPNSILLDLDTVLFLDKGKRVLGEVFDVLGQVADPLYCVRFNTNQHIQEKGINVGDIVYVAPKTEYTQYVILSSLIKMRGSDASWENDIEPPPRYLDYSDDEEEREARQKLRKHRRNSINAEVGEDKDDVEDKNNDATKRSRMHVGANNSADTTQQRHGVERRRGNRRQERFGQHDTYSPRTYQPQHNTNSWHSHYNQQYAVRAPAHSYRSPYGGPYQHQRPTYQNAPPRPHHFNQYVQHPISAPSAHTLPPPQMAPPHPMHAMPPQMHTMPHHSATYVPNPFAFRASTLPPQISQPQSTNANLFPPEPAPPGAE